MRNPDLVSLGSVREALAREGTRDLNSVAAAMQAAVARLTSVHPLTFGAHLEEGVDASAVVVGPDGKRRECVIWTHNVYLGLNRHPEVIQRTVAAIQKFGTGAGASPPVGGFTGVHERLARRLAEMMGKERAVIFSTGFAANMSALSGLPARGDLILHDRECHASMLQGSALSGAKMLIFRHNDVDDLASMLERFASAHANVYVVVESAYSMSGDLCPLRELVRLRERFNFRLFLDEAHTFGIYGPEGCGYAAELGLLKQVDFLSATFSKATAAVGGFVACSSDHARLLELSARTYLSQACFPPAVAATVDAALDVIASDPSHARALHENNRYMRAAFREAGFDLGSSASPIIPILVPEIDLLYTLAGALADDGVFAQPITEPGVPRGESRLRFIVSARHTKEQIDRSVEAVARHARRLKICVRSREESRCN